jgi:carbonic anhydrase
MQFLPFALTIASVLWLDLLKGVVVGVLIGVAFVLHQNSKDAVLLERPERGPVRVRFRRDGTFLSKPGIVAVLEAIEDGETVEVDATGHFLDQDVKELLAAFVEDAHARRITVLLRGVDLAGVTAGNGH